MALLEISSLRSGYGKIEALKGVDVVVEAGEIVTLIGANGAGKTTLLMTICGNPETLSGSIQFQGNKISGLPTHEIIRKGIAHAPEGRRIFPRMTVLENLQLGTPAHAADSSLFDQVYILFPIWRNAANNAVALYLGESNKCWQSGVHLCLDPHYFF